MHETDTPIYLNRSEYAHQATPEQLAECQIITDALDDILAAPLSINPSADNKQLSTVAFSEAGYFDSQRTYSYIEADQVGGWAWPLVEKQLSIFYSHDRSGLSTEQYQVVVDTIIHQLGVSKRPIRNTYDIAYYSNRTSVNASVESPDLSSKDQIFLARPAARYDQYQLFNEVAGLANLIDVSLARQGAA